MSNSKKLFISIIFEEQSMQAFISSLLITHYGFKFQNNEKNSILEKDDEITVFFASPQKQEEAGHSTLLKNLNKSIFRDYQLSIGYKKIIRLILWDSDGKKEEEKIEEVQKILTKKQVLSIVNYKDCKNNEKNIDIVYNTLAHINLESWLLNILKDANIQKEVLKPNLKKINQKIKNAEDLNSKQIYEKIVKKEYTYAKRKGSYFGEKINISKLQQYSESFDKIIIFLENLFKK